MSVRTIRPEILPPGVQPADTVRPRMGGAGGLFRDENLDLLSRLLESLLFGVGARDPLAFAAAPALPDRAARPARGHPKRLRESNSSFRGEETAENAAPVNRWKERLPKEEVAALEGLVGPCLQELGYALTTPEPERRLSVREKFLRAVYPELLSAKLWLKIKTPIGKFSNLSALELDESEVSEEIL